MAMPRGSAIISRIVRFTHRVAEMEPCGERDADEGSMVHDGGANASEPPISEVLVEESSEALLAVSADGVIVSWNRAAERIFGYSRQLAIGQRYDELTVPLERVAETRAAFAGAVRTGFMLLETVRRCADGEHITVDVSLRAVRDAAGALRFIAVNETDVSSLVRLRAAHAAGAPARLRAAHAAGGGSRGLVEAPPDAMVIVGENGRIALINGQTERLFGY